MNIEQHCTERFKWIPLEKLETLCSKGYKIIEVTVSGDDGECSIDEYGKCLWDPKENN